MSETKTALITGITGQSGSFLAELLLSKGYNVYGLVRRSSTSNTTNIDHIKSSLNLLSGDITDCSSLDAAIRESCPDCVYSLAAQSFVGTSWKQPILTADVTGLGTLRVLEALHKYDDSIKFYNAASSEMFGDVFEMPQTEKTPLNPRSPYGVAKVFGYHITKNYRESYGIHASSGILMNHESPRRGHEFVTRKITNAVAQIAAGNQETLHLGNLDAKRDWGYAGDYVEAMYLMLQQDVPGDYVISSGAAHSVREFVELAFKHADVDIGWYGSGTAETGIDTSTGDIRVAIDPAFYRPAEVDILLGDSTKAFNTFGWKPKTTFEELVKMMVDNDMKLAGV